MSLDYEAEYNNRARVPEHPEIFARWQREAAAYRAGVVKAELGLSYGPSPRQIIDFFPAEGGGRAPLAFYIHGGWWRSLEPAMFSQMARGANARGIGVALAGYDLCPQVSIAAIIEEMREACLFLWRKHRQRITVYGHSAGGHLAACLVATDFHALAADVPADLVRAGYVISGVFELAPLLQVSMNQDLRLDLAQARAASPIYWPVPPGRSLDAVVGALESSEFLRQSRIIADAWRMAAATRYREIAGMNHFTVVDALSDPASAMTARLVELAQLADAVPR